MRIRVQHLEPRQKSWEIESGGFLGRQWCSLLSELQASGNNNEKNKTPVWVVSEDSHLGSPLTSTYLHKLRCALGTDMSTHPHMSTHTDTHVSLSLSFSLARENGQSHTKTHWHAHIHACTHVHMGGGGVGALLCRMAVNSNGFGC